MEENYILAKKLVRKKFPNGTKYFELFVLGLYALLCKYNKEIVTNVFFNTNILFESGSLNDILKRNIINSIDHKYDELLQSDRVLSSAISSTGIYLCIQDGNVKVEKKNDPYIVVSTDNNTIDSLLINFVQEMGRLIKSSLNGYNVKEDKNKKIAYIRSGLNVNAISFDKRSEEYFYYKIADALDETINIFQTNEALHEIKALDGVIPDENVKKLYDRLYKPFLNNDISHRHVTSSIRPLWECDAFKKLIEDNIIEGKISTIKKSFDSKTYKGAFMKLGELLDDVDEIECVGGDFLMELLTFIKIRRIINKYRKKLFSSK